MCSIPVCKRLEDAPEPGADGFRIAIEIGEGWLREYVAKGGKWCRQSPPIYPASLD